MAGYLLMGPETSGPTKYYAKTVGVEGIPADHETEALGTVMVPASEMGSGTNMYTLTRADGSGEEHYFGIHRYVTEEELVEIGIALNEADLRSYEQNRAVAQRVMALLTQ